MLRKVTWQMWAVLGLAAAAYMVAGIWLHNSDRVESDINQWGWLAMLALPLLVAGVYSVTQHWWANDLGTAIALLVLGLAPLGGLSAWVFLVDGGNLKPGVLAWCWIGAPWWTAGVLAWLTFILMRINKDRKAER